MADMERDYNAAIFEREENARERAEVQAIIDRPRDANVVGVDAPPVPVQSGSAVGTETSLSQPARSDTPRTDAVTSVADDSTRYFLMAGALANLSRDLEREGVEMQKMECLANERANQHAADKKILRDIIAERATTIAGLNGYAERVERQRDDLRGALVPLLARFISLAEHEYSQGAIDSMPEVIAARAAIAKVGQ
jgi:hypothetical protein